MHSKSHNKTCFKYAPIGAERKCRFDFPRPLVEKTFITKHGSIDIRRNDAWLNSWNPALASLIRSNDTSIRCPIAPTNSAGFVHLDELPVHLTAEAYDATEPRNNGKSKKRAAEGRSIRCPIASIKCADFMHLDELPLQLRAEACDATAPRIDLESDDSAPAGPSQI